MSSKSDAFQRMNLTINALKCSRRRGILATDEAPHTLTHRFGTVGLPAPSPQETNAWRCALYEARGIEDWLAGVILHGPDAGETGTFGRPFADALASRGIVVGANGDTGRTLLRKGSPERITLGLSEMSSRIETFKNSGIRFAKWRAEYLITRDTPSMEVITRNAADIADFAEAVQRAGIVPFVEPDVLIRGSHSIEDCKLVTTTVLEHVVSALRRRQVNLSSLMIKLHMVTPGDGAVPCEHDLVGATTAEVVNRTVPSEVPIIAFLSGGQASDEANANLAAVIRNAVKLGERRHFTFSFGRSLQMRALHQWSMGSTDGAQRELIVALQRASESLIEGWRMVGVDCTP